MDDILNLMRWPRNLCCAWDRRALYE